MTRLRRSVAIIICLLVTAGAMQAPAQAGKKKPRRTERVVQDSYQSPALGTSTSSISICYVALRLGCIGFQFVPQDKYIQVDVEDALGQDVAVRLYRYLPDGNVVGKDDVCTSTRKPIRRAVAATDIAVFVFAGNCADGTPAMASTGDVIVTLSNLP